MSWLRSHRPAMAIPGVRPESVGSGRCRCGHFATDHMLVAPVPRSASFRLEPTGPCRRCGAAACPRMTPTPR